jgi:hypothetical protein
MSVHWEIEYPSMQLHGSKVGWTMKNVGDETAHSGTGCGEITIWQHPGTDQEAQVDTTPWVNPLSLDRDVEPNTAHTMTYPLEWTGQQHGTYSAKIDLTGGASSEIYFKATTWGITSAYD